MRQGMKEKNHLQKNQILLVEDDPSIQDYFRSILPEDVFMLYVVDNGTDALECIEGIVFDIIILDYRLKGDLSGIDVLRQCRSRTSALIYSNTGSPEHSAKMALLGADQALHKNSCLLHKALGLEGKKPFEKRHGYIDEAIEKSRSTG